MLGTVAAAAAMMLLSQPYGEAAASENLAPPVIMAAPAAPISTAPMPTPPPSVAESEVREFIAIVARKQAGRPAIGSIGPADKIMVIGLGRANVPEILGSAGLPQRQQLIAPPQEAVALVRFRQSRDPVMPGPSRHDLDYAARYKLPLFVIGEWSRNLPMWEVAWTGSRVQYRQIGDVGEIGPWHD
jgi:hypothetical protein